MLHHSLRAAQRGIHLVGALAVPTGGSGSPVALDLSGLGLAQGDLVVAWVGMGANTYTTIPTPSGGWALLNEGAVVIPSLGFLLLHAIHKRMGASPDTSVVLKTGTEFGVMCAAAFRGTLGSLVGTTFTESDDPAGLTLATDRGVSIVLHACLAPSPAAYAAGHPSGWTSVAGGAKKLTSYSYDYLSGGFARILSAPGTYNPGRVVTVDDESEVDLSVHAIFA